MDKIKFTPNHFWDKKTMTTDMFPTDEQWNRVETVCHNLNKKYKFEPGCQNHPEQIQEVSVTIFDDVIDLQIQKKDICGCTDIVKRLKHIVNIEFDILNKP
jgi:hypothetical protein